MHYVNKENHILCKSIIISQKIFGLANKIKSTCLQDKNFLWDNIERRDENDNEGTTAAAGHGQMDTC